MKLPYALIACLALATAPAHARSFSKQEANLMAATIKTLQAYKDAGLDGVMESVSGCYSRLQQSNPVVAKEAEFCIASDLSAFIIDKDVAKANGLPIDPRFTDRARAERAHPILVRAGLAKDPKDSQNYLLARLEKVQRYTAHGIGQEPLETTETETDK
ncbi:hypothetical protein [Methylovulum psychrotolerans]|jgi:hypothetical protein|uniref:Uncharacterized protein n=1 Tax=Methylovulum psychrotolerans TaxID=1704499 RepID=A0A1Z4BYM0_9GAMM|nr:hypothetical protein [Methylovulum psychrotolerans]ASF46349.1 hypothetical protein CEK71_09805 [Methylovulum psychrotolerans]MBT9099037.1 hypothetical protein [Methylovulum psychrotolerans]